MLKNCYALCCGTFLSLNNFELDLLSVRKRAEAITANGAVVDEDVRSVSALDKAEALGIVEPFDGSSFAFCHEFISFDDRVSLEQSMPKTSGRDLLLQAYAKDLL